VCLYATIPTDGFPYLVHPFPLMSDALENLFQLPYPFPREASPPAAPYSYSNGFYALGKHPSEVVIGWDWKTQTNVNVDTMIEIGTYANVTMVKTPQHTESTDYVSRAITAHQYGKGKCFWIRHCTSSEKLGDRCSATVDATGTFSGFCFRSSTGSLECGSLSEVRDKYGTNQLFLDQPSAGRHSNTQYACPHKAPVVTNGEHDVNRLLIAGCMVSSDGNYSAMADVHVPQLCATPQDYKKGCLFPRATNYDISAVQSDVCYYNVRGCTNSLAVNYNVEAYEDDASCIIAAKGCTLRSQYFGVATDTPSYDSSFVGVPLRSVGQVPYPSGATQLSTALNYDAGANVLEGCILTVEGCMESTALNYDSYANVNTNTWCIPIKRGCMMPPTGYAAVGYDPAVSNTIVNGATFARVHTRDGLAVNFDPTATVDSGCITEREGCMDSNARNYDPSATKAGTCWPAVTGCLHPGALNFGCASKFKNVSVGPFESFIKNFAPCTVNGIVTEASSHVSSQCVWQFAPPPPPPSSVPGNAILRIQASFSASENVEDFTAAAQAALCANYNGAIVSLNPTGCRVRVTAGSSEVTVDTRVGSSSDQEAGVSSLRSSLASLDSSSSVLGVNVLTTPEVTATFELPEDEAWPIIVGATIGGVFGLLLIVLLICYMKKRRQRLKVEA